MDDLISRSELIARLEEFKAVAGNRITHAIIDYVILDVKEIPAAEESRGEWLCRPLDNFRMVEVKCSECGWVGVENYDSYVDPSDFNYCPNCGARNDQEDLHGVNQI